MEKENLCCAVLGQHPMRFPWGFDEDDPGCQDLKLALAEGHLDYDPDARCNRHDHEHHGGECGHESCTDHHCHGN